MLNSINEIMVTEMNMQQMKKSAMELKKTGYKKALWSALRNY